MALSDKQESAFLEQIPRAIKPRPE